MDWGWAGQFSLSVVTGAVAALVATRLALGRFYKERWWEKKLTAYTGVLEAIHHIKRDITSSINEKVDGVPVPAAVKEKLNAKHTAAIEELERARDMGELLISKKAMEALQTLSSSMEEAAHAPGWEDFLQLSYTALETGLTDFRSAALSDLRLKTSLPWDQRR